MSEVMQDVVGDHDGGEWGDLCPPRCVSYPERVLNLNPSSSRATSSSTKNGSDTDLLTNSFASLVHRCICRYTHMTDT